jgi:hypothetical protein
MKVNWLVAIRAERNGGMFLAGCVALAAVATVLPVPAAAAAGGPASGGKSPAVTLKSIPGSTAKLVILSAKAAERLGIETGKVTEEPIVRKQIVSGVVIPALEKQPETKPAGGGFGGFGRVAAGVPPQPAAAPAKLPANGDAWVLVSLSPAEWERLAKDKPARLLPLATREKLRSEVFAQPTGMAPVEDMKRSMLTLYYVVPGKEHGLEMNKRMRVELQLSGGEEKQKVVPYRAVYYDAKGAPWVYVNGTPLTFQRQRIGVERIVGDLAVLSEGPAVGTPIVTVGAAMLYGAEIFGK